MPEQQSSLDSATCCWAGGNSAVDQQWKQTVVAGDVDWKVAIDFLSRCLDDSLLRRNNELISELNAIISKHLVSIDGRLCLDDLVGAPACVCPPRTDTGEGLAASAPCEHKLPELNEFDLGGDHRMHTKSKHGDDSNGNAAIPKHDHEGVPVQNMDCDSDLYGEVRQSVLSADVHEFDNNSINSSQLSWKQQAPALESHRANTQSKKARNRRPSISSLSTAEQAALRQQQVEIQKSKSIERMTWHGHDEVHVESCQSRLQSVMSSGSFTSLIAMAIISNSILIGVSVQYQAMQSDGYVPIVFQVSQLCFVLIFFVELIMRFLAERTGFFCTSENLVWNYFDLVVVGTSLPDVVYSVMRWTGSGFSFQESSTNTVARILRLIRITQTIRIVRILRVVRYIHALRTLVHSVFSTLTVLIWSFVLLLIVIYTFGILFTDSTLDHLRQTSVDDVDVNARVLAKRFGDLHRSMHTLLQCITNGLSWEEVYYALASIHWLWGYLFVVYITFCTFAVLNAITGEFCQKAMESSSRDKDLQIQSMAASREYQVTVLRNVVERIQANSLFTEEGIALYDFEQRLEDPEIQSFFHTLDLEVSDAWMFFKLMDDGRGFLGVEEFVDGCQRLKGSARSIDLAVVRQEQRRVKKLVDKLVSVIEQLSADLEPLLVPAR
eukprot:TRINITY_DN7485_c0_g1_i1.p1 TRINITY_DN7485_c0_g1~~TRINITY_DN7485_c0_g1_i1.p1  ORF type:complete len:665 (+),score=103.64 TRINITY_DN7485_c0_g1_i1:22-2016(+)